MHVVETSALSEPISFWVMLTACTQASRRRELGFDLSIAVNLAPSQTMAAEKPISGRLVPATRIARRNGSDKLRRMEY